MRPEDKWLVAEGKLAVAVVAKADADHVDPCSHDGLPRPELRPGRACRKGVGRNESPRDVHGVSTHQLGYVTKGSA